MDPKKVRIMISASGKRAAQASGGRRKRAGGARTVQRGTARQGNVGGIRSVARVRRTARIVTGPSTMPMARRGSDRTITDVTTVPILKATAGAFWYVTPMAFAKVLLPHLAMYDRAQLVACRVQYHNTVATGRDGLMFVAWDFDGTKCPGDYGAVVAHTNKRSVVLWQPSPIINIPLPPQFRLPVDKARLTADETGHFVPEGQSELAVGWVHSGIDDSAPTVLGHLVITITVRLLDLSPPPRAGESEIGANYLVGGPPAQARVEASQWIPEPEAVGEQVVTREFRPVSTTPAGPAMNAARARRVSPAPGAEKQ